MKKLFYILVLCVFASCTSNTIFEKPKDLIPRDTMELLIQEMFIAVSAKNIKNKNLETKVNYMPLVYDKFKIDSTRFKNSNHYYTTKIDLYQEILASVKINLEKKADELSALKKVNDSLRRDSLKQTGKKLPELKLKNKERRR